uniref:Uncharacterized protein n=1 Tax=Myotis lucifugus TaxID=59463 RepID=G1PZ86_MYOLU
ALARAAGSRSGGRRRWGPGAGVAAGSPWTTGWGGCSSWVGVAASHARQQD